MTTNAGKRLDRLEKLLDTIAIRNKQHHFIVLGPHETPEAKIAALNANDGDDIQTITLQWHVNKLSGSSYIPEGNTHDPLEDPRTRSGGSGGVESCVSTSDADLDPPTFQANADRERRWAEHVRKIELDGDRYEPKVKRSATY